MQLDKNEWQANRSRFSSHHAPRSANSDITNNIYVHIEFEVDGDEERKKTITQGTACE